MSTGVFVTDVSNIGGNVDMYAGTWSVYNTGWQSFTTQSNQPLAKFELKGVSTYKMSPYAAGTFIMRLFGSYSYGPAPYLYSAGIGQYPSAGYRPHLLEETFTTPSGSDKADYVWDIQAAAAQAAASGDTTAQDALNSAGAGAVFTVEFVPTDSAYIASNTTPGVSNLLQTISATDGGNASTMISNLTESSGTLNPENSYVFQTYYEVPASQLQTIAATATNFTQTEWVNAGSPAYFNLASGWTSIASAGQSSGQTFTNADNIGYIGIPTSVTTIGTFAFAGVTALQIISFDGGIGLTNIPDSMCRGCSNLAAINFGTANTTLKNIKTEAFNGCINLNNVVIPASVQAIYLSAFLDCANLRSLTIAAGSELETIGAYAFKASGITSFTVPGKVTAIALEAFRDCWSLSTITIEQSENWAYGLNFVNSIDLSTPFPSYSGNLSDDIFSRVVDNGDGPTVIRGPNINFNMTFGQIINGTNYISSSNFMYGGNNYFYNSGTGSVLNLTQRTGLITITNPNYTGSVDTGSKFTFDDWVAAGYPASFKVVGYETTGRSTQPPYIFDARFNGSDSTALQTLKGYMGTITHVEIGDGVTTIDGLLFDSMMNLTSITIGRDVASIPTGFVYTIPSVSSVFNTIALDNNTNFTVASNVLYKVNGANTKHTLVQYPLGNSVTNFSIPSGVVVLGDRAMASYNGMSVTIPTSLTTIEAYALLGCSNLSTITFATGTSSLTTIGSNAFAYNDNLTTISLPVSVTSIGNGAFANSSNLANVTFKGVSGSGNITIGSGAFTGTSSSLQVTLYNRVSIGGQLQSSIGTSTGSFFGSPVSTTINIIKAPDGFKPADRSALDAAITDWITAVDSGNTSNITAVTSSYGDINTWNVSLVNNMSGLFANKTTFNSNIGGWNTTLVTDMNTMFSGATAFDQDISGWTTSSVTNMQDMFLDADAFNQDLSGWDVSGITGNRFMTYEYTPPYVIPAPICFPAGTPVLTDQGEVDIDKIDPEKHTIRGKTIEGITETVATEDYVVMIHKNTFFKNVPIRDTIISANHKIMFRNQLIKAREFVDKNMYPRDIYKIPYTGYTLYNVLLEDYNGLMMVNNLIAETLSPTSVNAWLFRKLKSDISNSERKEVMDTYMQRLFPAPEITSFVIGCK
jgi:surface protein